MCFHILPLAHVFYLLTLFGTPPPHPPYGPDLAPSDFRLFTHLKQILGDTHLGSNEVKKAVKDWFNGLMAEICDTGIQKLITQYDKCLNLPGDYVKK
jgi:hypothetical protein